MAIQGLFDFLYSHVVAIYADSGELMLYVDGESKALSRSAISALVLPARSPAMTRHSAGVRTSG